METIQLFKHQSIVTSNSSYSHPDDFPIKNLQGLNEFTIQRTYSTYFSVGYLTIGMSSISRPGKTIYLLQTVHGLINNTSDNEKEDIYIVIFLADLDGPQKSATAAELSRRFGKYIDQGLLTVIEAYPEFYPSLTNIKERFGDSYSRRFWRSKQNLDTAYVMCYCRQLSQYYLHLEDDVKSSPSFVPKLQDLVKREKDVFLLIDVAVKGNVAKAYHSQDLETSASFFYLFYDEMPIDWLMGHLRKIKGPRFSERKVPMASLFQHLGTTSSFAENIRGNGSLEPLFDQYDQKYKGLNPPATVTSSLSPHEGKPQDAYDKGSGSFWGKAPEEGDYVLIKFHTATTVQAVFVDTGSYQARRDLLKSGVLQATFESAENVEQIKRENSCENFETVGSFDKGKVKVFLEKSKKIICLRIFVTQKQKGNIFLREIDVWP